MQSRLYTSALKRRCSHNVQKLWCCHHRSRGVGRWGTDANLKYINYRQNIRGCFLRLGWERKDLKKLVASNLQHGLRSKRFGVIPLFGNAQRDLAMCSNQTTLLHRSKGKALSTADKPLSMIGKYWDMNWGAVYPHSRFLERSASTNAPVIAFAPCAGCKASSVGWSRYISG